MRKIEPRHIHPGTDQGYQFLRRFTGRADGTNDLRLSSIPLGHWIQFPLSTSKVSEGVKKWAASPVLQGGQFVFGVLRFFHTFSEFKKILSQRFPLFERVMRSLRRFFRSLLRAKGGSDGSWDPEEKGDEDA
jgi:hypothetical protein